MSLILNYHNSPKMVDGGHHGGGGHVAWMHGTAWQPKANNHITFHI